AAPADILFDAAAISSSCRRSFHYSSARVRAEVQCQTVVAQTVGHILISSADADRDVHLEKPDAEPGRKAFHRRAATGRAANAGDYAGCKCAIEARHVNFRIPRPDRKSTRLNS